MMINIEDFAKMLEGEHAIMRQQTADLSHADSLLQPQPGGNCLNWVMGHLAVNLVEILGVLDEKLPQNLPDLTRYRIGSEPIRGEEEGVLSLQQLIDTYTELNNQVVNRLEIMSDADFEEEIEFWQGKMRRGYVAFFYFFHHTYHLGQLEYLRNLAGKTEKVI
jgi:hypothetical protein